ncbi:MAG: hypothetical protein AAF567_00655 [Actinomycetota bacterium]
MISTTTAEVVIMNIRKTAGMGVFVILVAASGSPIDPHLVSSSVQHSWIALGLVGLIGHRVLAGPIPIPAGHPSTAQRR